MGSLNPDQFGPDAVYENQKRGRWKSTIQPVPAGFSGNFRALPEGHYLIPTEHLRVQDQGRVRKKSGSALEQKIATEGIKTPVHISGDSNGAIVDGNHRVNAAKNLGLTHVPAMVTHMTPERMERWHGHHRR